MKIIEKKCKKCLSCVDICPVRAIAQKDDVMVIDDDCCLGCGCCVASCPSEAIIYE